MSDGRQAQFQKLRTECSSGLSGHTLAALGTAAALAALTSCGAAPNPDIDPYYEETDAGLFDAGAPDGGADVGE